MEIEVIDQELAKPADWKFHLDLWQHPSAVARAEGVDLWSEEHYEAMRPLMQMQVMSGLCSAMSNSFSSYSVSPLM